MWIASREESQAIDRRALGEFGLTSQELMEAEGSAVARVIREHFPTANRVGVVCGKGNNGGDGFVVARLMGAIAIPVFPESELSPECLVQFESARAAGVQIRTCDSNFAEFDLLVDAVLGTGFLGALRPEIAAILARMHAADKPIVSVDVPSGLDCNSGRSEGIRATHTVTFGLPKRGMFLADGPDTIGCLTVDDIGFPQELLGAVTELWLTEAAEVRRLLPTRNRNSHKGRNGRLLIIAGSDDMPGACLLTATAALRAGAGYICVASTPRVLGALSVVAPECVHVRLDELSHQIGLADAVVIGPGLGTSPTTRNMVEQVFGLLQSPACIDADALNLVSQGLPLPQVPCLLTPHPGELHRLIGTESSDRLDSLNRAVKQTGKTVLLKGAFTLIGTAENQTYVNPTGNAGMATAGMGDALAGIAGTLLAQGLSPHDAGVTAAYWHGAAGDLAAEELGPIGYTARDLIARLPSVRAKLVQSCVG